VHPVELVSKVATLQCAVGDSSSSVVQPQQQSDTECQCRTTPDRCIQQPQPHSPQCITPPPAALQAPPLQRRLPYAPRCCLLLLLLLLCCCCCRLYSCDPYAALPLVP
jgi:hypothetical protein